MVCIPCLVIPVALYIWYRFLQPIFLRFIKPWWPFGDSQEEAKGKSDVKNSDHVTEKEMLNASDSVTEKVLNGDVGVPDKTEPTAALSSGDTDKKRD